MIVYMYLAQPCVDPLSGIRSALSSAGFGSPGVTVALVDGLPDLAHPSLRSASIDVMRSMIPTGLGDADVHGTQVSSLIFGNGEPIVGLAPGCSGLVLPIFFGGSPDGRIRPASQLDLARAIAFALERGAAIINVSAGQKTATPEAETHLAQALARCAEDGALVVAAAGNDGCSCIHLPAVVPHVLAVGALDAAGKPLRTSNWGEAYRHNGLLAPGQDLSVALPGGATGAATGTSFAAAVVSGVAALLLSVAQREGYRLRAIDIGRILIETATPCELDGDGACDRYLAGTLNAAAALAALHRAGDAQPHAAAIPKAPRQDLSPVSTASVTGGITMREVRLGPVATPPQAVLPSACACGCDGEKEEEQESAELLNDDEADTPEAVLDQSGTVTRSKATAKTRPATKGLAGGLLQQGCACGGGQPPQIVFALGALWFDFGTEARYDAIVQQMSDPVRANNPTELFSFLRENPQFAAGITFILMQDQIPLYAIQPAGPFALATYEAIFDALTTSLDDAGREQRISLPGLISGSTRLMNGMTVPVVYPDLRGMYKWRSQDLIQATHEALGGTADAASDDEILNFLNRVYYELRNLGVAPQERALNFAATNAYQSRQAFADAASRRLVLDTISVTKSPICRPDSDCWDVQLAMFDPENERRASRVYRYTVDVSEILPVTVGPVRTWAARAGSV